MFYHFTVHIGKKQKFTLGQLKWLMVCYCWFPAFTAVNCAICGQCFCFSLSPALSLSAQVCPGHMTASRSAWNWVSTTAAIVLRERASEWWQKRKCSVSGNTLSHGALTCSSCSSFLPLAASGRDKHLQIHQSILCGSLSWKKEFDILMVFLFGSEQGRPS